MHDSRATDCWLAKRRANCASGLESSICPRPFPLLCSAGLIPPSPSPPHFQPLGNRARKGGARQACPIRGWPIRTRHPPGPCSHAGNGPLVGDRGMKGSQQRMIGVEVWKQKKGNKVIQLAGAEVGEKRWTEKTSVKILSLTALMKQENNNEKGGQGKKIINTLKVKLQFRISYIKARSNLKFRVFKLLSPYSEFAVVSCNFPLTLHLTLHTVKK